LIAEDEAHLLQPMEFILEAQGFRVTKAENGFKALRAYIHAKHSETPVDILITDIQMPGLNGNELVEEIRESDPLLPIIIITGYKNKVNDKMYLREYWRFIEKPFTESRIISAIYELLQVKQDTVDKMRKQEAQNGELL
jgi:DNA-binding NtrC family response regulator